MGPTSLTPAPAIDAGVMVEQVQDILIAVAPIVGTPRTMSAAAMITEALGIVIIAAEAEEQAGMLGGHGPCSMVDPSFRPEIRVLSATR